MAQRSSGRDASYSDEGEEIWVDAEEGYGYQAEEGDGYEAEHEDEEEDEAEDENKARNLALAKALSLTSSVEPSKAEQSMAVSPTEADKSTHSGREDAELAVALFRFKRNNPTLSRSENTMPATAISSSKTRVSSRNRTSLEELELMRKIQEAILESTLSAVKGKSPSQPEVMDDLNKEITPREAGDQGPAQVVPVSQSFSGEASTSGDRPPAAAAAAAAPNDSNDALPAGLLSPASSITTIIPSSKGKERATRPPHNYFDSTSLDITLYVTIRNPSTGTSSMTYHLPYPEARTFRDFNAKIQANFAPIRHTSYQVFLKEESGASVRLNGDGDWSMMTRRLHFEDAEVLRVSNKHGKYVVLEAVYGSKGG